MAERASSNANLITLSSLNYLPPSAVAQLLLEPTEKAKVAIIDVRDSDHIGGNINGSEWVPLHQLDVRMPELIRTHKDKEKVIFHCMLSQQRGPKAALAYARAKHRAQQKEAREAKEAAAEEEEEAKRVDAEEKNQSPKQEVCVLDGGFGAWQATFGEDPRLTADYQPDIWL
jgi:Cdc25 family phosphatase